MLRYVTQHRKNLIVELRTVSNDICNITNEVLLKFTQNERKRKT